MVIIILLVCLISFANAEPQNEFPSSTCCQTDSCHQYGKILSKQMDLSVDPCEDFHGYVCGNWKTTNGETVEEHLDLMQKVLFENLKFVMENKISQSKSKAVQYITDLYHECLSEENVGFEPVKQLLQQVLGLEEWSLDANNTIFLSSTSSNSVQELDGEANFYKTWKSWKMSRVDVALWMDSYVEASLIYDYLYETIVDFAENIKISSKINDFGHFDYYKRFEQYKNLLLMFVEQEELSASLENVIFEVVDFQGKLTEAHKSKSAQINIQPKNVQKISLAELNGNYSSPHFDWTLLLNKFVNRNGASFRFTDQDKVSVPIGELEFIKKFTELIASTPIRVLKNSIGFQILEYFYFDIKSREPKMPVWKYCLYRNYQKFPSLHTRLFVDSVGREQMQAKRDQAIEMFHQMKGVFAHSVEKNELSWLFNTTKQNILNTLDAMKAYIAFPDEMFDDDILDSTFGFDISDSVGQSVNGDYFKSGTNLARMLKNARFRSAINSTNLLNIESKFYFGLKSSYDSNLNILAISTVELFEEFKVDYPASINFENLGFKIGQAMIKLANVSRMNDQNKNKNNRPKMNISSVGFGALSTCFVEQYDGLKEPITGVKINGTRTLEQNIVDSGALNRAYRAFEKHLNQSNNSCSPQKLPSFLAQFTHEQLFFISYGSHFCSDYKNSTELIDGFQEDTRSPDKFLVNVPLSNMDSFSKAFNCPLGSPMNLEKKCELLW